jgi:hypothetical protein
MALSPLSINVHIVLGTKSWLACVSNFNTQENSIIDNTHLRGRDCGELIAGLFFVYCVSGGEGEEGRRGG